MSRFWNYYTLLFDRKNSADKISYFITWGLAMSLWIVGFFLFKMFLYAFGLGLMFALLIKLTVNHFYFYPYWTRLLIYLRKQINEKTTKKRR